jgi:hypothetical protein
MNEEPVTTGRRVNRRYSAEDRVRLIREHASSVLTKKAFCKQQQGINAGTFKGWRNLPAAKNASSVFAQVEVPSDPQAAVEIIFPNGARVGIRHQGCLEELIALVRGVAGAA